MTEVAVGREGHGVDVARMALERLEHRTPIRLHSRIFLDPHRDILFKRCSNNTLLWSKDKRRTI